MSETAPVLPGADEAYDATLLCSSPSGRRTPPVTPLDRHSDLSKIDLQSVLMNMPTAVMVVEAPAGKIRFYNSTAARLLALPFPFAGDLSDGIWENARNVEGRLFPLDTHPLLRALQHGDRLHQAEVRIDRADGTGVYLALNVSPLPHEQGEILTAIITFDDISARIQAEQEQRRQHDHIEDVLESLEVTQEELLLTRLAVETERQRYQELFEFATDGYLVTDMAGVLIEANAPALTRLGIPLAFAVGKILASYIAQEDRTRFHLFLNLLSRAEGRMEWEGHIAPRHDAPFDASLTVAVVQDQARQPVRLRWLLCDITARKRLEQAREADQQRLLEQERRAGVLGERNRIAQEFHDTLAQSFTGIVFLLAAAEDALAEEPEKARSQIVRARQVASGSITDARRAIQALRMQALENGNLPAALARLVEQISADSGIKMEFQVKGVPVCLPVQTEDDLLRIGQEALTNILKHAQADSILIRLRFALHEVELCIEDNGRGFVADVSRPASGFGLIGMRERARRNGGQLRFDSEPGQGMQIIATFPLRDAPAILPFDARIEA